MRFLSDEWIEALVAALKSADDLRDDDVTVHQVVTGTPDGETAYWLAFESGDVKGAKGAPPAKADVTITMDHATAVDLAREEINAQAAFMQGRLKVTGNMGKLLQHQAAISALGPAMASIATEF